MDFLARLNQPERLILDGATGTELTRRGVDTGLPLWSANALLTDQNTQVLKQIHLDYLAAGADILTTNTFRTHVRALAPSGNASRALELTSRAVKVARDAIAEMADDKPRYVAGSISTLEDCYRPDLVPSDNECQAEHSERVQQLYESGIDLFLLETFNCIREALIVTRLAVATGKPVIVSFACNPGGAILSGETLRQAAKKLIPLDVVALGVNCSSTPTLAAPLSELHAMCGPDFPLIAYGNIGYADDTVGWINTDAETPSVYCQHSRAWPAHIVGGCCGTTPAHIAQLKTTL